MAGRALRPLCANCNHPAPFHGREGRCNALGCSTCTGYLSPYADRPKVKPGQVWEDNDPRRPGRQIKVDAIEGDTAVVTIVKTTAPHYTGSGLGAVKRIKVARFKPTQTGYRLVSDV